MLSNYFFFYLSHRRSMSFLFFFFNDTATTEIYTLSLHDALPISQENDLCCLAGLPVEVALAHVTVGIQDRKSTRLNSSHSQISYAVFCLKKKKRKNPKVSGPVWTG